MMGIYVHTQSNENSLAERGNNIIAVPLLHRQANPF
jgi:hypothetical protein